ncbi:hypothetical protein Aph01nite_80140 [Acrocarpospora phusangensis]|uniref:Uncharacterized protein n=1 Tax=Acrocarpospora phusangensis TaxID=1070424 RepID=A0A919UQE2_9ACTN|nr:hypothetical protein Aph01nite_80140 [Acrocarpospora phusangensis]
MRGNLTMRWSLPREDQRHRGDERGGIQDTGNRGPKRRAHQLSASWAVDAD